LLCLFFSQLAFVSWLKLENLFKNLILLYLKQEDKPSIALIKEGHFESQTNYWVRHAMVFKFCFKPMAWRIQKEK
jgi:hypothetical protein